MGIFGDGLLTFTKKTIQFARSSMMKIIVADVIVGHFMYYVEPFYCLVVVDVWCFSIYKASKSSL